MSDELFIDLSDQQQELVIGGFFTSLYENVESSYFLDKLGVNSFAIAGPNGSYSSTTFDALDIESIINKTTQLDVSTPPD
ncbi:CTB family bacteriocin [Acaryochloris sp. IP29b_bin.137]|uniref:CTB family bacteriocin n=1 Tax=Acaryochloris sp. IP29b_bin.137 TaxID=2969217 RepID=UPI00261BA76E|nr:CTB family bacteriocin [Acaryochloris sp. IP29b_bin.137]